MEAVDLIAGLAWDPEIRGFLAVLTGVVVLMGSVWLLLATNSGIRLGTLIALAGFFGWMVIMAAIWWIYGIGYRGDAPRWEQVEIVEGFGGEGHLSFAALDEAELLRSENLRTAHDLVVEAYAGLGSVTDPELRTEIEVANEEFGVITVADLTADATEGLTAQEQEALAEEEYAKNRATTLSELAAVAPSLINQNDDSLGGWTLLSTAQAGEAQASAIAMLLASGDFSFSSQNEFKILDSFTIGGKRGLPSDPSRWDRIETQIRTALTLKHPTRYGIVQMQAVLPESIDNLPGQVPKRPIADPDEPVVSVVMIRNLGNLRLVPALVTLGSLLIFLALCYMLHERDKVVMARVAEFNKGSG
ncbi:MAG: hypothetical protein OXN44_04610 [Acidimicrobiaceae bacterium]|nr:hypothetical protein [Acidimicrobiaceae bacterium]MDE0607680.1 hypothetical protein [Acidimicrobiaceae bacterium]